MKSILINDNLHVRVKKACVNNLISIGEMVEKALECALPVYEEEYKKDSSIGIIPFSPLDNGKIRDEIYDEICRLYNIYAPSGSLPEPNVEFIRQLFYSGGIKKVSRK